MMLSVLEFYGFIFSANGISADPKKAAAILQASEPKDLREIRSLLGMVNYCARFIQDFSTISAPLRDLTKKGTSWQWGDTHKQALQPLKDALASATTTSYFDPTKDTELVVDASPVGLCAILSAIWTKMHHCIRQSCTQ
ncbi:pol gene product [Labeo rohita]|uniref:Pol gene product n=1 Tax=Labeo rohita TaxID=84645 RepID=A0A498NKF4_LABRO|nr:pol gene product [Labeo rohita]RXN32345.1 pol gene product [Labeo rohita]